MHKIIIVDDEKRMLRILQVNLSRFGEVMTFSDPLEALEHMKELHQNKLSPSILLTDIQMPGISGDVLLERAKALFPELNVVIMTAYGSIERAVNSMKNGAADYLVKPLDLEQLANMVERLLNSIASRPDARTTKSLASDSNKGNSSKAVQPTSNAQSHLGLEKLGDMISRSPLMHELFSTISKVASEPVSILIQGESGTGKELAARAIHTLSERASGPFVAVNCAAIPSELLESELFGHKAGAFTDAQADRTGRFVQADGGTIFLDEIGEMPLALQPKLLRALQELQVTPVGAVEPINLDIRVISATNRDLKRLMENSVFREDLYYRLNVVSLKMPALRERPEDIVSLTEHFLDVFSREGRSASISDEAVNMLLAYSWPGNVRELENVLQHGLALSPNGLIETSSLPSDLDMSGEAVPRTAEELKQAKQRAREEMANQIERAFLVAMLTRTSGNVSKSSKEAGMDRRQFQNLMRKHNIDGESFRMTTSCAANANE